MNIKTRLTREFDYIKDILLVKGISMTDVYVRVYETWRNLRVYIKGISAKDLDRVDSFLGKYNPEIYYLSDEMIKEGLDIINNINLNNVNSCISAYYSLIETLMIYSRPDYDCCRVCQGDYNYLYSIKLDQIVQECKTCSSILLYPSNIHGGYKQIDVGEIRFATYEDLKRFGIVNTKLP